MCRTEGRGETLIIPDITETKSDNCFIIHCFEIDNDKYTFTRNRFDIALGLHARQEIWYSPSRKTLG